MPDREGSVESPHPLDPWGGWVLRWFAAVLAAAVVAGALFLAVRAGPAAPLWLVFGSTFLVLVAGIMTAGAAGLRWALSLVAPAEGRAGIVVVVVLGASAAVLTSFGLSAVDDPRSLLEPGRARRDLPLILPALVTGGIASYLAERRVSLRTGRWWLTVAAAGAVAAGVLDVLW